MNFNLIGAGCLGKNLAFSLINHKIQLQTLCNTTLISSQTSTKLLGAGKPIASLTELGPSDLLWLTVPDDQITILVHTLAKNKILKPGTIVIHCSGVLSSACLDPLAHQGCWTASLHPLKVFSRSPPFVSNAFHDCYCALEGSPRAIKIIEPLFKALGAIPFSIQPEKKALYHAAAVITSNYLVTLATIGDQLFKKAGIDANLTKFMTQQLMQSSLNAIEKTVSIKDALTGPLARGDTHTIQHHLTALHDKRIRQFYCAAALATLPLTELDAKQKETLHALLNSQAGDIL